LVAHSPNSGTRCRGAVHPNSLNKSSGGPRNQRWPEDALVRFSARIPVRPNRRRAGARGQRPCSAHPTAKRVVTSTPYSSLHAARRRDTRPRERRAAASASRHVSAACRDTGRDLASGGFRRRCVCCPASCRTRAALAASAPGLWYSLAQGRYSWLHYRGMLIDAGYSSTRPRSRLIEASPSQRPSPRHQTHNSRSG
jgi:hypothetical protein